MTKSSSAIDSSEGAALARLYQARFSAAELAAKDRVWGILCHDFFQKYVRSSDRVLDVAAGYCEFINRIECGHKVAFDANPDVARYAASDVKVVVGDCRDMSSLPADSFDVAFVSNFFEHLESKSDLDLVLTQIFGRLRPGGKLLILQPNIRYLGSRYWDFYDHFTPLSHLSMQEALVKHGFRIESVIPKFLPYTFKGRLPAAGWMVRLYLKAPPAQWLMGKQMFIFAARPAS